MQACIDRPSRSEFAITIENAVSESALAFRPEIRFWRAPMRRERGKFFYCQTLRLRVRARVILTASVSRNDIDRVSIVNCAI
jgi:hypothetical protein